MVMLRAFSLRKLVPYNCCPSTFCDRPSSSDATSGSDEQDTKKPLWAARRIAEKAAIIERAEQFQRFMRQGIGALNAHRRAEGVYKESLEQFTRMASEQTRRRAEAQGEAHGKDGEGEAEQRLFKLAEQCKESISMEIKKDFERGYSADNEHLQRDYLEQRKQFLLATEQQNSDIPSTKIFSKLPKGYRPIFEGDITSLKERPLKFWRELDNRRTEILAKALGPKNLFEEQIEWTKKGMMWPYPINNEFMSGEEEKMSFVDHVFLEPELAKYKLPRSGPIAHFMELVLNGLSRNPYMSVKKKHDHIKWYAEYFTEVMQGKYKYLLR